jgi:phospholipid N-methyltransferase
MSRLSDYQTFLTQFLRSYNTTGAVIPSGRALCSSLCRYVGSSGRPQRILEAGPGTGAVTRCIIDRMGPADHLWMVELNPAFAAHLRRAFEEQPRFRAVAGRCHLVEGAVQELAHGEQFDLVISGLPLNNFSSDDVRDIMQAYSQLLKPGGVLSFFEYILVRPAKMFVSGGAERDRLKGVGDVIGSVLGEKAIAKEWVWVNVPPAWVHHLRF